MTFLMFWDFPCGDPTGNVQIYVITGKQRRKTKRGMPDPQPPPLPKKKNSHIATVLGRHR